MLFYKNSYELAYVEANAATYALILNNKMWRARLTDNSVFGAFLGAYSTACALFHIYIKDAQFLTHTSLAFSIEDMFFKFFLEIFHGT